jgi:hypothetical protein
MLCTVTGTVSFKPPASLALTSKCGGRDIDVRPNWKEKPVMRPPGPPMTPGSQT